MSAADRLERLIAAACRTAEELGVSVFPVRVEADPGIAGKTIKRPLVKGWQAGTAASNPAGIDELFQQHAGAVTHAGVVTGGAGRLLVLDLDGEAAQAWWREHSGMLPATRTVDTQRPGGKHLYYRMPRGVELRNSAGKLAPHVDVRSDGGFVVDWSIDNPPVVEEVADAPLELIEFIRRASSITNNTAVSSTTSTSTNGAGMIPPGKRNDFLSREAYHMRRTGATIAQIIEALTTLNSSRCSPPLEATEVRQIAEGKERVEPEHEHAEAAPRPVIQLVAGGLHTYADASERLLADAVYVRGQRLARFGLAPELSRELAHGFVRNPEQRVIVPVSAEWLRRELNTRAEYQKFARVRNMWEPVNCPLDLVHNIAEVGDWKHFRPLEGIATAPFLRADGTICDTPGYDAPSRVYYAPNAPFPQIPTDPNKDDADAAMERLLEPFSQFPFATEGARAGFLAHLLAAAARHAIDTRPVLIYSAPLAATGKTLLAGMPSRIADGVEPAERPFTDDGEELRKVLMSALLAGDSTLLLDNIPNGSRVRSPVLCGFVTAPVYSDRRLGVSESPTLPNRCQVIGTGNNVTPSSDLARRCIVVRLDVEAESARGRTFRIADLKEYVREHRARLLCDALLVIRAHLLAGSPTNLHPLESFERWSRFARDPVAWLGYGDAVASQECETEDELGPLRDAFRWLSAHPTFATADFTARDLAKACEQLVVGEDLRRAIEAAGCRDATDATKIGYWLRHHRDRIASGRKLVNVGTNQGTRSWHLKKTV